MTAPLPPAYTITPAQHETVAHTPGPWSVEIEADCDDCQADIYVCHPGTVCDVTVVCTMGQTAAASPEQKLADARLIAVAPELLTALCQYRDDLRYPPAADSRERRLAMVEALIAKATGAA